MQVHDITHPDCDPPDCPAWAKETLSPEMQARRGRRGLPEPYCNRHEPLAMNVRGLDRYHANQFLGLTPETHDYIYSEFTPLEVSYTPGLLPSFEALVAEIVKPGMSETEKAIALLKQGASRVKHPSMPPCGRYVPGDRNLDDEALLASGAGWCNEQARVYIRLCQVAGIPARFVHVFYSDHKTGHCVTEFYADGRWCMADASWFCVYPGPDGKLLSVAQCHDRGEGQKYAGIALHKRMQELLALSDEEINMVNESSNEEWRAKTSAKTAEYHAAFYNAAAFVNYPLPVPTA